MKEMTSEEKTDLLSTAVGAVMTMVVGMGLSILFGGIVRGFLAMGVVALGVLVFLAWRHSLSVAPMARAPLAKLVARPRQDE